MSSELKITENESRYLKLIYRKQEEESEKVKTNSIAKSLGVQPATVTETLQKLAGKNLLSYEPYQEVKLTDLGSSEAQNLLRKHRLLEFLFSKQLDYDMKESCDEASKIDFHISEELANSICRTYNHPESCPCGKVIFRNTERNERKEGGK